MKTKVEKSDYILSDVRIYIYIYMCVAEHHTLELRAQKQNVGWIYKVRIDINFHTVCLCLITNQ